MVGALRLSPEDRPMTLRHITQAPLARTAGLVALITTCYVLLQLVNLSHRWVDDESWYLMPLPSIHQEGRFRAPAVPGDDVFWAQPPLLTYLEAGLDRLSPLTASTARAIPLCVGALTIIAGFLLGQCLFGKAAGLWTAVFLAADNLVFLASRTVRPEILVTLFLALSLWCAANAIQALQRKTIWLYLSGLFSAAAVWSHPNGLMAPASVCLFWLWNCRWDKTLLRRFLHLAIAIALFVAPLVLWIAYFDGPSGFSSFQSHWLHRYGRTATVVSPTFGGRVIALLSAEWHGRYTDFVQFPYRLHVALAVLALTIGSMLLGPAPVRSLAVLVVFQVLFFAFGNNSNPSVRYLTTLAPLIALLAAFWLLQLWHKYRSARNRVAGSCAAFLVLTFGVSQLAGDGLYLWKSRSADYERVSRSVDALIPPNSVIYGGMFWWMGLREHTLVPYMRMPWQRAVREWHPGVVIADDWVMANSSTSGNWRSLRAELAAYLREHGRLLGEVDGRFYGDLKVYAVEYGASPTSPPVGP